MDHSFYSMKLDEGDVQVGDWCVFNIVSCITESVHAVRYNLHFDDDI